MASMYDQELSRNSAMLLVVALANAQLQRLFDLQMQVCDISHQKMLEQTQHLLQNAVTHHRKISMMDLYRKFTTVGNRRNQSPTNPNLILVITKLLSSILSAKSSRSSCWKLWFRQHLLIQFFKRTHLICLESLVTSTSTIT